MTQRRTERLVVVGNGMVGHRFLELLAARVGRQAKVGEDASPAFEVTVIGEEPRLAYDRVGLSTFFDGRTPDEMTLPAPGQYEAAGFAVHLDARATGLDRERRVVVVEKKVARNVNEAVDTQEIAYDRLILATG